MIRADMRGGELLRALLRQIRRDAAGVGVKAGVLAGATNMVNGEPVARYAAYNEFGTAHIPSRSFLRSAMEERDEQWARGLAALLRNRLGRPGAAKQAFSLLGREMQSDIVDKIKSHVPPPNSPETVRRKKAFYEQTPPSRGTAANTAQTLIWTGSLLKSIDFEVTNSGE